MNRIITMAFFLCLAVGAVSCSSDSSGGGGGCGAPSVPPVPGASSSSGLTCGAGTHQSGNQCVKN